MSNETNAPVILVINDDRIQLKLIEAALRDDGMEVLACGSGSEALRLLAGGVPVSVVLTDLHMPDIDGWSLCSLLRSSDYLACNWLPILAMSAIAEEEGQKVVMELGADAFLPIPYAREALREKVKMLLDKRVLEPRRTVALAMSDPAMTDQIERCFLNSGDILRRVPDLADVEQITGENRPDVLLLDQTTFGEESQRWLAATFGANWPITVVVTTGVTSAEKVKLIRAGADACVEWPEAKVTLMFLLVRLRRLRALVAKQRAGITGQPPPGTGSSEAKG